jgi:hypothetical protein
VSVKWNESVIGRRYGRGRMGVFRMIGMWDVLEGIWIEMRF